MIKKSFLILPALLLCLGVAGCKKDTPNKNEEKIILCSGLQSEKVIEIEDLQTKLSFLVPYQGIGPAVIINPEGVSYRYTAKSAELVYTNPEGQIISGYICNFPDYALNWNRKNLLNVAIGDSRIEGEVDIIISGKFYISYEVQQSSPPIIKGTFELTSLKKQNN
jgi:hypothetical protein